MKGALFAAAALYGAVVSADAHPGHIHHQLHRRGAEAPAETCGCTTFVTTITGEAYLMQETTTLSSTTTTTVAVTPPGPTPLVTIFPTPGVYTVPENTVTVTEEVTVCAAATTSVPAGEVTYGGVVTVVEYPTTVIIPYAAVESTGTTETWIIKETEHVCASAGTCTIAPITSSYSQPTVVVYPTPESYAPGTYIQPETVVTVTETEKLYICAYTLSGMPAPTTAPPPPPPPSPEAPPPPAPTPSSSPSPAESSPEESSPEESSPEESSPAESPSLGGSGEKWCFTYSPYTSDGGCKDAGAVEKDIAIIAEKGFASVRIYAPDCNGLETVGNAVRGHGLKLVLGIFIETTIEASRTQLEEIVEWAQFDLVELVVVGNEAIFNGKCDVGQLAAYISEVKSTLAGAGYNGPCTTTEPVNILEEYGSELCSVVDVMGCNSHPFFNAGTSAEEAGDFLGGQIEIVAGICSGKDVVVLETGWPHAGEANGKAVPGIEEQKIAIEGIVKVAGSKCAIFTFEDDNWKVPGDFGVEQSWGCHQLF